MPLRYSSIARPRRGASAFPLAAAAALFLASCAGEQKEWMKMTAPYTAEEFRRDWNDCRRAPEDVTACLRQRGWEAVTPTPGDRTPEPAPKVIVPPKYGR